MKPLLAAKLEKLTDIRFPVLATPKLDGIRCILWHGMALTRKLKPIPNHYIRHALESTYSLNLDGELMIPGADFNGIQSAVMSENGHPDFRYVIFDVIRPDLPYRERVSLHPLCLRPILIESEMTLLEYERKCLAEGYEGVMLRSPDGPYKFGRSTVREGALLKWKRFSDDEAVVIGFEERLHNTNEALKDELGYTKRSSGKSGMVLSGTLGALRVKHANGKEFALGTGFNDADRSRIWSERQAYLGKIVTYTFQELSSKGLPRFPVFRGFRPEMEPEFSIDS